MAATPGNLDAHIYACCVPGCPRFVCCIFPFRPFSVRICTLYFPVLGGRKYCIFCRISAHFSVRVLLTHIVFTPYLSARFPVLCVVFFCFVRCIFRFCTLYFGPAWRSFLLRFVAFVDFASRIQFLGHWARCGARVTLAFLVQRCVVVPLRAEVEKLFGKPTDRDVVGKVVQNTKQDSRCHALSTKSRGCRLFRHAIGFVAPMNSAVVLMVIVRCPEMDSRALRQASANRVEFRRSRRVQQNERLTRRPRAA